MKRTFTLVLTLVLLMGIVHSPVSAQEEISGEKTWTYDNSLIVTVNVAEEKTFTPEDFPEVEVEELYVFGKSATDTGYSYDILLVIDVTAGWYYMTMAENSLKQNPAVVKIERNRFANDYAIRESNIKLNMNEVYLTVGTSVELFLEDASIKSTVTTSAGIMLKPKDGIVMDNDYLSSYGLYLLNADDGYYKATISFADYLPVEDYVYMMNTLYALDIIESAYMLEEEYPIHYYENWENINSAIVNAYTHGGIEYYNEYGDLEVLYQSTRITGVSVGTTYLIIDHCGSCDICIIHVGDRGDVTGDGKVTSLDAAMILRYDAGLEAFDDLAIAAADYDGDGRVTSLDAALVLRYDAGL